MTKRNITVQVNEQARVIAARRGTSISALLAQRLCTLAAADARYEQARARALEAMSDAVDRGGATWRREDLYDR